MPNTTILSTESVTGWPFTVRTRTAAVPGFDDPNNSFLSRDTSTDSFDTAYSRSGKRVFPKTQSVTDANGIIRTVSVANLIDIGPNSNSGGGGGGSAVVVTMQQIRLKQTQSPDTLQIGITADGNWEYQVARTATATNSQGEYQIIPDWGAAAWTDLPAGSAAAERIISTPGAYVNKWLQARIRNKALLTEIYEIPVIGARYYDWMVFSKPTGGLIYANNFQVLPYRTWSNDLIITSEVSSTPGKVNVRFVSGFQRQNGTVWYWWLSGVPLFDRANTDNFTVELPKGYMFDVTRFVCPDTFRYYNQQGQVYDSQPAFQMQGNYYENSADAVTLNSLDEARFWTGR